jgi:hypothetical protein
MAGVNITPLKRDVRGAVVACRALFLGWSAVRPPSGAQGATFRGFDRLIGGFVEPDATNRVRIRSDIRLRGA